MTEERRQELVAQRQVQIERDAQLQKLGHLVNGEQIIQKVLASRAAMPVEEPVLVGGRGGRPAAKAASGKKISVRR
jgi:hypothetical protein